jgi:hypothetical protein
LAAFLPSLYVLLSSSVSESGAGSSSPHEDVETVERPYCRVFDVEAEDAGGGVMDARLAPYDESLSSLKALGGYRIVSSADVPIDPGGRAMDLAGGGSVVLEGNDRGDVRIGYRRGDGEVVSSFKASLDEQPLLFVYRASRAPYRLLILDCCIDGA